MKKIILLSFLTIVLFSCKSKKNASSSDIENDTLNIENNYIKSKSNTLNKEELEAYSKITNEHYAIDNRFKTLQINADVDFKNASLNENVTADIRIQRGETILITIKKFGFTGAKILITPNKVSFYEILNGSYYDGNFEFISSFLGTNLDYNQVENLLLGLAIFNLKEEPLKTKKEENIYKLYKETNELNLVFVLDDLARIKQEVIQPKNTTDKLVIDYLSYQTKDSILLPLNLLIRAIQKGETNIRVNYKKVEVNPNISFPYKVPNGSKQIFF